MDLDSGSILEDDFSKKNRISERLLFGVVLLMGFCQYLLPGSNGDASTGSPTTNALWSVVYAFAFLLLYIERKPALRLIRGSFPLIALLLLASCSTLWSVDPAATARRSLELIGTSAIAMCFVCRLGLKGFLETLAFTLSSAAFASLVVVILFPGLQSSDDLDGAWQGVFDHKNALGLAMVLGIVTIACLVGEQRGRRRIFHLATLLVMLMLLIGSRAAGGYASAFAIVLLIPFLLWSRAQRVSKTVVTTMFVLVSVLAIGTLATLSFDLEFDDLLALFGKDSTLTGRTDLWRLVIDAIGQRPTLGYGYGVFWGSDGPAANLIYPAMAGHWEPGSAHNGFLEVALYTGLAGELLLILLLITGIWKAFLSLWRGHDIMSAWPLCAILCSIFLNLSEATFAMANLVDWIVLVAALLFAADVRKQPKIPQHSYPEPIQSYTYIP